MSLILTKKNKKREGTHNQIEEFLGALNFEIEEEIKKTSYKSTLSSEKFKNTQIAKERYQELNKIASAAINPFK